MTEDKKTPMTDEDRQLRGRILDDLHDRQRQLKKIATETGKPYNHPKGWAEKLEDLSACDCSKKLAKIADWHAKLPPKQYAAEKITWEIFSDHQQASFETVRKMAIDELISTGAISDETKGWHARIAGCGEAANPETAMLKLDGLRAQLKEVLKNDAAR